MELELRKTGNESIHKPETIEIPEHGELEAACCHFWRIAAANGAHSLGVCKFCGKEKEFMNGSSNNSKWEAISRARLGNRL